MEQERRSFAAIYDYMLGIFSIVSIVFPKQVAIAFILFLGIVIAGAIKKQLHFKPNALLISFALLYITYLAFGLKTNHPDLALSYFERKASFLLIPILFAFQFKQNKPSFEWAKKGLLLAVTVLAIQSLFRILYSAEKGWGFQKHYYSSFFSYQHHPSYATVFYTFALCLVWWEYKRNNTGYSLRKIIPFSILMLAAIVLCQSLAGLLFIVALATVTTLAFIFKKAGKKWGIATLCISPLVIYLLIQFPPLKSQWDSAKKFTAQYLNNPTQFVEQHKYPMSGSEVRLVMWTVSAKIFSENPMGVGTGNVDEHIYKYLVKLKQKELAKKDYNPHNQYLQTGIETGIIGLSILLAIIGYAIYNAFNFRVWMILILASNIFFNMCFESMLQQQSGIVFYTFWLCLLYTYPLSADKRSNEN